MCVLWLFAVSMVYLLISSSNPFIAGVTGKLSCHYSRFKSLRDGIEHWVLTLVAQQSEDVLTRQIIITARTDDATNTLQSSYEVAFCPVALRTTKATGEWANSEGNLKRNL